jgi:glycosyltransferase involved in cell wall biosynthesis
MKPKLIRTSTVSISLDKLLEGQLSFLNKHFDVKGVASGGALLAKVAKREGVEVITVDMQRKISPIKDVCSLFKLILLFQKEKPLIVHSITPKAGLLSMMAAFIARVPIRMHTYTGLIFPSKTGVLQKILIMMDKILCACATNVYPEGEGVKRDLLQYGITKKPLKVLANGNVNGINLEYFNKEKLKDSALDALKIRLGIADKNLVFVFVGRLVGDKGINELVAAFKKLQSNNKFDAQHPKLLLVGSFEQELDPLRIETILEIENNELIISVGYQDDVRPYLAISDVFVLPSYREGFPNVVLQAGAMGLPCIVTDINGSNEIIQQSVNGQIIPKKSVIDLFNAMELYLNNINLLNQHQSKARELIKEKYECQVVWDALLEEYKQL